MAVSPSPSAAAAIRWSNRCWRVDGGPFVANDCDLSPPPPTYPPPLAGESREEAGRILAHHWTQHGGENRRSCAECADLPYSRRWGVSCRRAGASYRRGSTGCSRAVGAADDLAPGRSTSWSEMVRDGGDPSNQAARDARSSSSTNRRARHFWTGLSIAWATIEHLHAAIGCGALFATHFHEMTALASKLRGFTTPPCASRRMAGRGGVPARSHWAGAGRPLLWHPGGENLPACRRACIERAKLVLAQLDKRKTAPRRAAS